MPESQTIEKAELREIEWQGSQPRELTKRVEVQFNPETLKVAFTNQLSGGDQSGGAAVQFVAKSITKLTMDLWFDVTVDPEAGASETPRDVRELTREVAYFMQPKAAVGRGRRRKKPVPGVRFLWGSFLFDGVMESINESLELFSEQGRPLRAKLSVSLSRQDIQYQIRELDQPSDVQTPGIVPRQPARAGDTAQSVAADNGRPGDWRSLAEDNDLENPRHIPSGTPLDTSSVRN